MQLHGHMHVPAAVHTATSNQEPIKVTISLGLQIAQTRSYSYTLGPKVGIIYVLGALGYSAESGSPRSRSHGGQVAPLLRQEVGCRDVHLLL